MAALRRILTRSSADALIGAAADVEAFRRMPAVCLFNPAGHLTARECARACCAGRAPSQTSEDSHFTLQTFAAAPDRLDQIPPEGGREGRMQARTSATDHLVLPTPNAILRSPRSLFAMTPRLCLSPPPPPPLPSCSVYSHTFGTIGQRPSSAPPHAHVKLPLPGVTFLKTSGQTRNLQRAPRLRRLCSPLTRFQSQRANRTRIVCFFFHE